MKGRRIEYTPEQLAWLEEHRTLSIRDYHAKFVERFGVEIAATNLHALRKRRGWRTGRTGRFEPGRVSEWTGVKRPSNPNSAATQFKAGHRGGRAVEIYQPIGAERVTKEGYLQRKVNDDMPFQARWRMVHRINWEAVHGPLPKGMALKCLDGDRLNTDASNWVAIKRSVLPRLNGGKATRTIAYDTAPAELRPAILAIAQIDDAVHQATKKGRSA